MVLEMLKVIVLGIVEGITEWLPISSTGHMLLVDEFIHLNMSDSFLEMFFVVIQLGAILAVCVIFFQKLWPFQKSKRKKNEILSLWSKVIVGCIPAGVLGILFDDFLDAHFYNWQTISFTLILYGILFIVVEYFQRDRQSNIDSFRDLSYKTALLIGCFQVLSLIPGTSRSGATIIGALLLGTSRFIATEYSFYLSIPVMFGASFLKLLKFGFHFTGTELAVLIVGMVVAFAVSIAAIKFLLNYIKKNDFTVFGIYRIILGALVIIYGLVIGF
ncbi:MAG: undecaprenyl-diphosphate phosphatase [Lachnospiraceae bacterium]|nr:undecaprenyl-diphosphate phosphatase [Lachnospiraceae bacterium]